MMAQKRKMWRCRIKEKNKMFVYLSYLKDGIMFSAIPLWLMRLSWNVFANNLFVYPYQ